MASERWPMDEVPFARATPRLVADLIRDAQRFISAELDLARAELSQSRAYLSSGIAALAGGAVFVLMGLILFLVAASLFLVRLGLATDVAFFLVAAISIGVGGILLWSGKNALQPRKLLPARSLAQISSLLGRR